MHAPDTLLTGPAAAGLGAALTRRWNRYARELRRLRHDGLGERAVHDCRVAARRLMTLLRLLERMAPKGGAHALRRRVRRTFRGLGRLRDVQVERGLAAARTAPHPVLHRLVRNLRAVERRLQRTARPLLAPDDCAEQARRYGSLRRRWGRGVPAAVALRPVQRALQGELCALAAAVAQRDAAVGAGDPEALHAVRVALKKFRYLLEVARSLDGAALDTTLARAKRWQSRLGHLQDLRVLRDDAALYAAAHPDPGWPDALAALDAELVAGTRAYLRVRHRLRALVERWAEAPAPAVPPR